MGEMTAALEKLARLLGIPGDLHAYETPDEWSYGEVSLSGATALADLEALLPELRDRYGDALELSLRSSDDWTEAQFNGAVSIPPLNDLHEAIEAGSTLTLDVKIRKAKLTAKHQWTDASFATRLFLFSASAGANARGPASRCSIPRSSRTFPPIRSSSSSCPHTISGFDGAWLRIVGGKAMSQWRNGIARPPAEPQALALAEQHLNRVRFDPKRLTPMHLAVETKQSAETEIRLRVRFTRSCSSAARYISRANRHGTRVPSRGRARLHPTGRRPRIEIVAPATASKMDSGRRPVPRPARPLDVRKGSRCRRSADRRPARGRRRSVEQQRYRERNGDSSSRRRDLETRAMGLGVVYRRGSSRSTCRR